MGHYPEPRGIYHYSLPFPYRRPGRPLRFLIAASAARCLAPPAMPVSLLVRVVLWIWFLASIAVGQFLLLQRLPPMGLQAIILVLTIAVLLAYFRIPALRTWVDALELRSLVLIHVTRFVGIYFLILFERGELPRAFAVPGGIGDIIVATMALPVALAPLEEATRRRAIVIWNVVGFVDILVVVLTATRINLSTPGALRALTHLPLSLLPTFLVPLIIATHIIIFTRASRAEQPSV
jgi:hypothetical protein